MLQIQASEIDHPLLLTVLIKLLHMERHEIGIHRHQHHGLVVIKKDHLIQAVLI